MTFREGLLLPTVINPSQFTVFRAFAATQHDGIDPQNARLFPEKRYFSVCLAHELFGYFEFSCALASSARFWCPAGPHSDAR